MKRKTLHPFVKQAWYLFTCLDFRDRAILLRLQARWLREKPPTGARPIGSVRQQQTVAALADLGGEATMFEIAEQAELPVKLVRRATESLRQQGIVVSLGLKQKTPFRPRSVIRLVADPKKYLNGE